MPFLRQMLCKTQHVRAIFAYFFGSIAHFAIKNSSSHFEDAKTTLNCASSFSVTNIESSFLSSRRVSKRSDSPLFQRITTVAQKPTVTEFVIFKPIINIRRLQNERIVVRPWPPNYYILKDEVGITYSLHVY